MNGDGPLEVLVLGRATGMVSPVIARSLVQAGARVICGHSFGERPLRSRYYAGYLGYPDPDDGEAFCGFLLDHARRHPDQVMLPSTDEVLRAMAPVRPELDGLVSLAAAPPEAASIALDKARTIGFAAGLTDAIVPPLTIAPASAEEAVEQWTVPGR